MRNLKRLKQDEEMKFYNDKNENSYKEYLSLQNQ